MSEETLDLTDLSVGYRNNGRVVILLRCAYCDEKKKVWQDMSKSPRKYCSLKCTGMVGGRKTPRVKIDTIDWFEYDDTYAISQEGEIYNKKKEFVLSQSTTPQGYKVVTLHGNRMFVHRLITHIHLGPIPDKLMVNHRDGNKLNNQISNLEYVTAGENISHAIRTGLMKRGQRI